MLHGLIETKSAAGTDNLAVDALESAQPTAIVHVSAPVSSSRRLTVDKLRARLADASRCNARDVSTRRRERALHYNSYSVALTARARSHVP